VKIRKKIISTLVLLVGFFVSCQEDVDNSIPHAPDVIDLSNSFYYEVNLDDRSDDTFKVRMFVDALTADNHTISCNHTRHIRHSRHWPLRYNLQSV
jgi:hypothetical protein